MKELMNTNPLDKIRVTGICRVAEIERPTFYYHFKGKHDLVVWVFLSDAYDNTDNKNPRKAETLSYGDFAIINRSRMFQEISDPHKEEISSLPGITFNAPFLAVMIDAPAFANLRISERVCSFNPSRP